MMKHNTAIFMFSFMELFHICFIPKVISEKAERIIVKLYFPKIDNSIYVPMEKFIVIPILLLSSNNPLERDYRHSHI